ncbi:MAG TPA: hypothetical protein VHS03_02210 [Gaiellaceae bacterium]|nr:hypothetical protein [Gaiellaceae bacterium]
MSRRFHFDRLPRELVAVVALLLTRVLPDSGLGLYLKLAAATLVLLLPGSLIARLLGRPSVSASVAWSLAGIFGAGAIVFAVHGSLDLALGLYAALGAGALVVLVGQPVVSGRSRPLFVIALGIVGGLLLWHVAGALGGDALFHLARVRKLLAFGDLHLKTVDEFKDGSLHPGYAFPLWHLFLAFVARLSGVDAGRVVLHEASVLCPLAFAVVFESGRAVFRSRGAAFAVLAATVGLFGLAGGHGGSYVYLALPATAARQLLVPVVIALFFWNVRTPSRAGVSTLAAAGLGLALVHPTYAVFVLVPLAGYVAARWLLARVELQHGLLALVALIVPAAAVSLWLLPVVRETASHNPSDAKLAQNLKHYGDQLVVYSLHSYRVAAPLFARVGAVAVAALVCVPLAYCGRRRRWAALVLGGTVVVAALTLVPPFFTTFSDIVSLSQARRVVGFVPFAFAFAGGCAVLSRWLGRWVLPLALGAGIALDLAWPGDFANAPGDGGPAAAAWIAAVGGTAALVAGAVTWRRARGHERPGRLTALAAVAFVLPVAVSGFSHWSPPPAMPGLSAGLVRALHRYVPKGSIVFSDDSTAYLVAAAVPVYINAAPPGHVAQTKANRPFARRDDANQFLATGNLAIPRRYGAQFVVLDLSRRAPKLGLPRLYRDEGFALYRLPRTQSR